MTIVLSGLLPSGDRNGIEAIVEALTTEPDRGQMIVAVVTCSKVTSHSDGKVVVTAKIVDIEACDYGTAGWETARHLLDQVRETRTGKVPLPLSDDA